MGSSKSGNGRVVKGALVAVAGLVTLKVLRSKRGGAAETPATPAAPGPTGPPFAGEPVVPDPDQPQAGATPDPDALKPDPDAPTRAATADESA